MTNVPMCRASLARDQSVDHKSNIDQGLRDDDCPKEDFPGLVETNKLQHVDAE